MRDLRPDHGLDLRREVPVRRDGARELRQHPVEGLRAGLRFMVSKIDKLTNFANLQNLNFANFWRARSRLYQNDILQQNMRLTAFFKLYKICILLHRFNLKFFAKIGLKNCEFRKISENFRKFWQILLIF